MKEFYLIFLQAVLPYIVLLIIVLIGYFALRNNFPLIFGSKNGDGGQSSIGADIGSSVGDSIVGAASSIITGTIGELAKLVPPPKKPGEACTLHTDCAGYQVFGPSLVCSNGTCKDKVKDWTGEWVVPADCLDAPSPLGKPGSCGSGNSWPRKAGQPCDTHLACEGYVALQNTLTCSSGKCEQAKKDWAGVWYPPQDCVGAIFGKPGTC